MYVLFDEDAVIRELARRGLKVLNPEDRPLSVKRAAMQGWECKNCGHVIKLNKKDDGTCNVCLSAVLNPIFGVDAFFEKATARKKQIAAIRKMQTRY